MATDTQKRAISRHVSSFEEVGRRQCFQSRINHAQLVTFASVDEPNKQSASYYGLNDGTEQRNYAKFHFLFESMPWMRAWHRFPS